MTGNISSLTVCFCSLRYLSGPQKIPFLGSSHKGRIFLFKILCHSFKIHCKNVENYRFCLYKRLSYNRGEINELSKKKNMIFLPDEKNRNKKRPQKPVKDCGLKHILCYLKSVWFSSRGSHSSGSQPLGGSGLRYSPFVWYWYMRMVWICQHPLSSFTKSSQ